MGASQRRKGHNFERDVVHFFRSHLGLSATEVKRGLSQPRGGTGEEPDVILPDSLRWWVECKVGARPNLLAALDQARDGIKKAGSYKMPMVVAKRDREEPVVLLELEDFLKVVSEVRDLRAIIDRWPDRFPPKTQP